MVVGAGDFSYLVCGAEEIVVFFCAKLDGFSGFYDSRNVGYGFDIGLFLGDVGVIEGEAYCFIIFSGDGPMENGF